MSGGPVKPAPSLAGEVGPECVASSVGTSSDQSEITGRAGTPSNLVAIHVSPSVAVILAALAAERSVSVTRMVTILTIEAAEAVGIGALAAEVRDDV